MTKTTRSTVVMGVALGLAAPVVGGCGLGVLSRAPVPDAAQDTAPPPLTVCDPANLPSPGCAQTCADAQAILQTTCSVCHSAATPSGTPLQSITDYHGLSNAPASSKYPRGVVYVLPGDPDHSLIYERIVAREMPPPSSDVSVKLPSPSVSDWSILREWIQSCVPNIPGPDAGTPPPVVDAGSDGSGPYTYTTCPTAPPAGSCSIQGMVCPYPTQTCTCDGGSWGCQSCPVAQPANGSTCPSAAGNTATVASFACAFGNVTCNCAHIDPNLPDPPTWACGVCPATAPSNGQACGNTSISCAYDQQQCDCLGGTWGCLAPSCDQSGIESIPGRCAGFYSCGYPQIDQACTCSGTLATFVDQTCSCPVAAPRNGSFCKVTPAPCVYSDQTCSCAAESGWQCVQQCPDTRPTDGAACGSSLNCSYGGGLCYCDGASWHCS